MVADLAGHVAAIIERMVEVEEETLEQVEATIAELVPELYADAAIAGETRAASRANVRRFFELAKQIEDPPAIRVPAEALDQARTVVRRGIDINALFQGYRAGHQVVWGRWLEAAGEVVEPGPDFSEILELSLNLMFRYVDTAVAQVVNEAHREREEVLGGALARRTEAIRLILDGAPFEEEVATRRLNYDLSAEHTALVIWADEPVPQSALESAAMMVARATGTRRPLTMVAGTTALWVWMASTGPVSMPAARKAITSAHAAVRVAVGSTESGIAGFRRSHAAALEVHRLMSGQAGGEQVASYAELEVTALAAHDEDLAADFVANTLGPLAVDDAKAARLRETLRVFLDEADNAPRTAARLHTHRNTVLQRVARTTELLGHDVGERRLALSLALELAHRLGSRVLVKS